MRKQKHTGTRSAREHALVALLMLGAIGGGLAHLHHRSDTNDSAWSAAPTESLMPSRTAIGEPETSIAPGDPSTGEGIGSAVDFAPVSHPALRDVQVIEQLIEPAGNAHRVVRWTRAVDICNEREVLVKDVFEWDEALGEWRESAKEAMLADELLVVFEEGGRVDAQDFANWHGIDYIGATADGRVHRYRVGDAEIERMVAIFEAAAATRGVAISSGNGLVWPAAVPNDPEYPFWALTTIKAESAWDLERDGRIHDRKPVIIAVLDTGTDMTNADYDFWTNPGEIPNNGIDDDKNGYIDDVRGWDFNGSDKDASGGGHGAEVIKTAASLGNNGLRRVGTAWNVQVMNLKVMSETGAGSTFDAMDGLIYAINNGAHVANCSFIAGGGSMWEIYAKEAQKKNLIIVAAAGNTGAEVTGTFPACLPQDNVIGVAASDASDNRQPSTGWSPTRIDLFAPGNATSFSTPVVSGAVALMIGDDPGKHYSVYIDRILQGVDQLPQFNGYCVTGGRLNIRRSLELNPLRRPNGLTAGRDSSGKVILSWTDRSTTETGFVVERSTRDPATVADPDTGISWTVLSDGIGAGTTSYVDASANTNTEYFYRVRAKSGTTLSPRNPETRVSSESGGTGGGGSTDPVDPVDPKEPVLTAPALTAKMLSTSEIELRWTYSGDSSALLAFEIAESSGSFTPLSGATAVSPASAVLKVGSLKSGTNYSFRARAYLDSVQGAWSSTVTARTQSPPVESIYTASDGVVWKTTGDNASRGEGLVNLFDGTTATKCLWFSKTSTVSADFTKATVVSYGAIEISSANDAPSRDPVKVSVTAGGVTKTYSIPGYTARFQTQIIPIETLLGSGVVSFVFETAGDSILQFSELRLVTVDELNPPPPPPNVEAPVLTAAAQSTSAIALSWTYAGDADATLRIEVSESGGAYAPVAGMEALLPTATPVSVTGLKEDTLYAFRARAEKDGTIGAWSAIASARTDAPPPPPPPEPEPEPTPQPISFERSITLSDGTIWATTGDYNEKGEGLENLFDGAPETKSLWFLEQVDLGVTLPTELATRPIIAIDITSANDVPDRDPVLVRVTVDGIESQYAIPAFSGRFVTQRIAISPVSASQILFSLATAGHKTLQISEFHLVFEPTEEPPVEPLLMPLPQPDVAWNLDDGSGNQIAATSANGEILKLNRGAKWLSSEPFASGSHLGFDGMGGIATLSDSPSINASVRSQYAVSLWFRAADILTRQVIFKQGGASRGLNLYIENGALHGGAWNLPLNESAWRGSWVAASSIAPGTWHHAVLVIDAGTAVIPGGLKLYVDGALAGTAAASQLWPDRNGGILGGVAEVTRFADGSSILSGAWFDGEIDELQFFNRALDPAQIAVLAGAELMADDLVLEAVALDSERAQLSWNQPTSAADSFEIEWAANDDTPAVLPDPVPATETSAILGGLLPGVNYAFRVRSVTAGIAGAWSPTATLSMPDAMSMAAADAPAASLSWTLTGGGKSFADDQNHGVALQLVSPARLTDIGSASASLALDFSGGRGMANLASSALINASTRSQYAISMWIYAADCASSAPQVIFQQGDSLRGLRIAMDCGGLTASAWNTPAAESAWNGSSISSPDVRSGSWHHIVVVLDAGSSVVVDGFRLYLDGTLVGSAPASQLWPHAAPATIGAAVHAAPDSMGGEPGTGINFDGLVDDLQIFDHALSAEEVRRLFATQY